MQTDWMTELDKQLRRGKHVLLYGNVEDRYELKDRYDPLDKCLDSYFRDRGYCGIIHYDIAEKGRVFPEAAKNVFRTCDNVDQIRRHLIDQDEKPVAAVFEYSDRSGTQRADSPQKNVYSSPPHQAGNTQRKQRVFN